MFRRLGAAAGPRYTGRRWALGRAEFCDSARRVVWTLLPADTWRCSHF